MAPQGGGEEVSAQFGMESLLGAVGAGHEALEPRGLQVPADDADAAGPDQAAAQVQGDEQTEHVVKPVGAAKESLFALRPLDPVKPVALRAEGAARNTDLAGDGPFAQTALALLVEVDHAGGLLDAGVVGLGLPRILWRARRRARVRGRGLLAKFLFHKPERGSADRACASPERVFRPCSSIDEVTTRARPGW
jgi:hypothetical protein